MARAWQEISQRPEFQALPHEAQQRAQRLFFDDNLAPSLPDSVRERAFAVFSKDYPLGGPGRLGTPPPQPMPDLARAGAGAAPLSPFGIPAGMGTPERAGLTGASDQEILAQMTQGERAAMLRTARATGTQTPQETLDQLLTLMGSEGHETAPPQTKLQLLRLAASALNSPPPQESLVQGEQPSFARRALAQAAAGSIGVKHAPAVERFIEATPELEGIPGAVAGGIGAIADPISLAAFGVGGGAGLGTARALGGGKAIQALARGIGGFTAFDTAAEAGRQVETGDFDPAALGKAAGRGAVMGAAIAPATLIANPAVRYLVESAIFGTAGPVMEGRAPTLEDYAESLAFLGVLRTAEAIPKRARQALAKEPAQRTPEDQAAIEAVKPEEWQAAGEEIKLLPGEGGTPERPATTLVPQRELDRGTAEVRPLTTAAQLKAPEEIQAALDVSRETPAVATPGPVAATPPAAPSSALRSRRKAAAKPQAPPEPVAEPQAPARGLRAKIEALDDTDLVIASQQKGRGGEIARELLATTRRPPMETVEPAKDTFVGVNDAGDRLYERAGGDRYRIRTDRKDRPDGYVDFGGDLAIVEAPPTVPAVAPARPVAASEAPKRAAEPAQASEAPKAAKEPWEMTRAQYVKEAVASEKAGRPKFGTPAEADYWEDFWRRVPAAHRSEVEAAIASGRPVPEAVLKDYNKQKAFLKKSGKKPAPKPTETPAPAAEAPKPKRILKSTAKAEAAPAGGPALEVPAIDLAARRKARPTGQEGALNLGTPKPKPLKATAGGDFQPEAKWGKDWWTEGLQNSLIRIDRLEKYGKERGATAEPGRAAEAYIGRVGHQIEQATRELQDGILKPAFDAGFKPSELSRYMQALHVEERQATMAERGFRGDDAAGMTVADARQIIASTPAEVRPYADKLRAYVDKTLDIMVDGQLIPQDVATEWRARWRHYVPLLRDFGAGESVSAGRGGGFSATAGVKKAKGSRREALDILAQIATARARAVSLAERGKVGRELLKLVEEAELENQGWRVEDAESFFVDQNGQLILREATKDMKNKDNVLSIPVEGRTVKLVIPPEQQGVIRAMKGLGVEKTIPILREFTNFQRYMATTGNLEFMLTNLTRDTQEAGIHLAEKGPKAQARVILDLPAALKGVADHISGKDTEWSRWREEMASEGGLTHWSRQSRDVNEMAKEIEKLAERIETAKTPETRTLNAIRTIGKGVEAMNEVVEGGIRLSAYKNLREAGVPAREAALFVKNMTLNFDKKGRWGGFIGSAYMFFNVGVQGPTRMVQFAKKNPGKFATITGSLALMGYLEAMHNHSANPEEYEKRQPWERDNFWSFMVPGEKGAAAVLRVPYGYNTFKALGGTAYDLQAGLIGKGDATSRMFSNLMDGFSPIQGRTAAEFFAPNALDLPIQIAMNKSWFGSPMKPDQPPYQAKVPESTLYFKSARPQTVALAKKLNEATGGNERISGWFDVSPEVMDYTADFLGGGVSKLAGRTVSTTTKLVRGEDIDPNQVPFARQFYRVSTKGVERNHVYHMLDESGRRIYTDAEVEKFNRYLDEAVAKGDIDSAKAARYRNDFANNQREAAGEEVPPARGLRTTRSRRPRRPTRGN